ncbi:MAG: serine/threonine-protein phosphatase [Methyloprofundus sp.]|nr:serine/threonine-protein phosphatase [Methyloprofundus sp.]
MQRKKVGWSSWGKTHVGMQRKVNQDALLDLAEQGLWVVADGMGGHHRGDLASSKIIEALQSFKAEKRAGFAVQKIYQQLDKVNAELIECAAQLGQNVVIGSTIALLYADKKHCIIVWSGDSRIYLFRRGTLKQLSLDHNNEQSFLDQGFSAEDLVNHPYAQALAHAVGGETSVYLDMQIQEVREGDIFLLCSDGLNKELSDCDIESVLQGLPYRQAVDEMMDLALQRGGRDNITILAAKVI